METSLSRISRRTFCAASAALFAQAALGLEPHTEANAFTLVAHVDRKRILAAAKRYLPLPPKTITSFPSSKSPGGLHDYFSEADYWWPNPTTPNGPYVERDGQSDPYNFNGHRAAMIALSIQMPALTAAWLLTGDEKYGRHAADHLRAWFINPATVMNPNLEFSQGVHGKSTGRSYGIIDTLHLVEVARAASIVAPKMLTSTESQTLREWFTNYLHWMQTSKKGITERDAKNNHATCWGLQAAEFARLIGDAQTQSFVAARYKDDLLPNQMAKDGSFPLELARTKPYSYSIFNFDVMATLCQSLLDHDRNLFAYTLPDGRSICRAATFLYPYLRDRDAWPYRKDVEHFTSLPVRSPGLLFTGIACDADKEVQLWKTLNPDPTDSEIVRNYPIRQPLLWFPA
ncbi:MAG: alginate lyase family protein [Acidobacteriaceae bacterium]